MTKQEFEKIAGYEISAEEYVEIIEPMYMATDLNKYDFAKTLNRKAFEKKHKYPRVIIGVKAMPNGTWMTYEAELIDINIKTGKAKVRRLSDNRCWAETSFDFHCTRVKEVK